MRYFLFFFLILFSSCDELIDVLQFDGPCTILLKNGRTITTQQNIEVLESTGTITYRDDDGKLWSIPVNEYESYSCGI
jgi:hypothetical protein